MAITPHDACPCVSYDVLCSQLNRGSEVASSRFLDLRAERLPEAQGNRVASKPGSALTGNSDAWAWFGRLIGLFRHETRKVRPGQ